MIFFRNVDTIFEFINISKYRIYFNGEVVDLKDFF